ncbi:MAG: glycosyltransferase [Saprospiraceae bacterium]
MSLLIPTLLVVYSLLLLGYAVCLFVASTNFTKEQKEEDVSLDYSISFNILIAARNEENSIQACLHSIIPLLADFPHAKVFVINDHSTDNTKVVVENMIHPRIHCLDLPYGREGKKQAITFGVEYVDSEIILMTDADCIVSVEWIHSILKAYHDQPKTVMTTGIVLPNRATSFLEKFQFLDFAATMTMTHFGLQRNLFYLANGANMSFSRQAFLTVQGYRGNEDNLSGDDVFLSKKLSVLPNKNILFINNREGLVYTEPESTWKDLWNQRVRWATKTKAYANHYLVFFLGLSFFFALSLLLLLLGAVLLDVQYIIFFIFLFSMKETIDYFFLKSLCKYFNEEKANKYFIISFSIYQIYILLMGIKALFPTNISWKGRESKA